MMARIIAALLLATVVVATAIPAWSGTITGTVRFKGPVPPKKKTPVTIDQYICGKDVDDDEIVVSADRGVKNAVVHLKMSAAPSGPRLPSPVQMDQKQCVFVPRVLVVPSGGTVEFLNSDRLLHNLHSKSDANASFNRTQPRGRTIPVTFTTPEVVRITCDLHSWMRAWVVVAEHPFYAVTDDQGAFKLQNVPPGKHTLAVWHETLAATTVTVTATEGTSTIAVEIGAR